MASKVLAEGRPSGHEEKKMGTASREHEQIICLLDWLRFGPKSLKISPRPWVDSWGIISP